MLDKIAGFEVELTNRCTLACPKCSRTVFQKTFGMKNWRNHDLNIVDLKRFLDCNLAGVKINFGGNYGDPIYHKQLHEIVGWVKRRGAHVGITTNGSYRSQAWWQQLADIVDHKDEINFAIDGTPENFTQYRINANWESILAGIKIVAPATRVRYKFIPFSYNENSIEYAQQLAGELGMEFIFERSDRWDGKDDPLKPQSAELVSSQTEHVLHWVPNQQYNISPKCKTTNKEHYISAEGYYLPCCWAHDYRMYYKTDFYKGREHYNISKTTISQLLAESSPLIEFYNSVEEKPMQVCSFQCPKL